MFGPPPRQYVADLARDVKLTEAQQAEVFKLLEAQETRLRTMQDEARTVFIREQEGLHDRIAAVLTPDQATAFRAWVTSRTGRRGGGSGPPR
jgi:Spy/CpxP family protein refolding chaperone